MNNKFQIFVSSTYEDLKLEREAAIKAILEIGHIPVGMEMFSAGDEDQWRLIKRQIDDCDYYVVLLAHKYGSKDGPISYTEKEYDYAVSKGIPALGFIIDNATEWPKTKMDADIADQSALEAFKTKVKRKMVDSWKSKEDLYGKIAIALSKTFVTHPRPGWVRATVNVGPAVTNELSRLSEENSQLRASLSSANAKAKSDAASEVQRTMDLLNANQPDIRLGFEGEEGFRSQGPTSLLWIFYLAAQQMMVEKSETDLNKALGRLLRVITFRPGKTLRAPYPIPTNVFQVWLGHFMALELVEPSKRKHPVSDKDLYWTLSDFGRSVQRQMHLNLLRNDAASTSATPSSPPEAQPEGERKDVARPKPKQRS